MSGIPFSVKRFHTVQVFNAYCQIMKNTVLQADFKKKSGMIVMHFDILMLYVSFHAPVPLGSMHRASLLHSINTGF